MPKGANSTIFREGMARVNKKQSGSTLAYQQNIQLNHLGTACQLKPCRKANSD